MEETELFFFLFLGPPSSTPTSGSHEDTETTEDVPWIETAGQLLIDLTASVAFWYVLLFVEFPGNTGWIVFGALIASMIGWRLYRAYGLKEDWPLDIPYTCGYMAKDDKEVFIVATLHISPRAPRDVKEIIDITNPDVAMIELDEERLDRMRDRDPEAPLPTEPDPADLQKIRIIAGGGQTMTVRAQRALWNAEQSGKRIEGDIVFDPSNPYGLDGLNDSVYGNIALVHRGAPSGEFAPFALKSHNAARGNAEALLVINSDNQGSKLPLGRIGGSASVLGDLRVAVNTCSCGFPPVPVLLLNNEDGKKVQELCEKQTAPAIKAALEVMPDHYPRRTLRKRLCQACALMFSGIGILYGIIQCFNVEVGAEFIAAEEAATAHNIPCACIDVDLNQFWSRLGMAVLPTPCNVAQSLLAWLAFPRVFFRVLYPPRGNVDVVGGMILHAASFSLMTWVAFILAGFCASCVTNFLLTAFGMGATKAAEGAGVVQEEDSEDVQNYIMLGVEMYMLPRIYQAVAASRDETMYRMMVSKARELSASKMVVVVGAAHSNGILQRIRARGL